MYAGDIWPRRSWLQALHNCKSGRRLKIIIDNSPNNEFYFDNTTQAVTEKSNGIAQIDYNHITTVLAEQKCDMILACGNQATEAAKKYADYPILSVPHPASRTLKNSLYITAAKILESGFSGKLRLIQGRECIKVETL
jgi:hypothetical protein